MNGKLAGVFERHRDAIAADWTQHIFNEAVVRKWNISFGNQSEPSQLTHHYVRPMLDLLTTYLTGKDENYRLVYLDERLRHAPFNLPQEERCRYFGEILPLDLASVISRIESEGLRQSASQWWSEVHAPLLTVASTPVSILAIGDCLMNEIRVFLPTVCRERGIDVDMRYLYFSATMNASLSIDQIAEYLKSNRVDMLAISFFSFEGIPLYSHILRECESLSRPEIESRVTTLLNQAGSLLQEISKLTDVPVLVHNVSGLPLAWSRRLIPFRPPQSARKRYLVDRLNLGLAGLVDHTSNCILVDERQVAIQQGLKKLSRPVISRRLRSDALFHTTLIGKALSEVYSLEIARYRLLSRKKLILVDFDHTLWEGVMADGPVTQHRQRQELLRQLSEAGIVLAAVTKNTESNIRWNEMTLQPEHFAIRKINWNLKVQSIREIGSELNLGVDSFVLIDDNPAERALVERELPRVTTFDSNDPETWTTLGRLFQYPNTQETEEARNRTKMYQMQAKRQELLEQKVDQRELMSSLRLEMSFRRATGKDLKRISELVARTNQFNTTTRRHSETALQELSNRATAALYVSELQDKFGSLGLVAVAILTERDSETIEFDSLVMSCRAMGFGVENQLVREIVQDLSPRYKRFIGLFLPSDRNQPCALVFKQNNFRASGSNEWEYLAGESEPIPAIEWIKVRKS